MNVRTLSILVVMLGFLGGCANLDRAPTNAPRPHSAPSTLLTLQEQEETWNLYKRSMHQVVLATKNPRDAATEQFILKHGLFVDNAVGPRPLPPKGAFYVLVINGDLSAQTDWERNWSLEDHNFASFVHPDNVLVIKRGGLSLSDKLKGSMLLHEGSHAERNLYSSYSPDDRQAYLIDELLAYEQQIQEVRVICGGGYANLRPRVLRTARAVLKNSPNGQLDVRSLQEVARPFLSDGQLRYTAQAFGLSRDVSFDEVGIPFQFLAYDCMFQALGEACKTSAEARAKRLALLDSIYAGHQ